MRSALISLEPWDDVWRRNQHLAVELVRQGLITSLVFVEPLRFGRFQAFPTRVPVPGITVASPTLTVPKRAGGYRVAAAAARRGLLAGVDLLWVNDPQFGVHCLGAGGRAVYDVTDDWRSFSFPSRVRRRIVRAEDRLAVRAGTVVCSEVLRERWQDRYGVEAAVVRNGTDPELWQAAVPRQLPGPAPHVGYVGTLHEQRLDVELVLSLARDPRVGTVHLVGPDALDEESRARLAAEPAVRLHGPVPAAEVPSWTVAMDVLVSPHLVNDFTLSLDAIKSHEYLASGRPVVATPTSGFQRLTAAGLAVVPAGRQADAVAAAVAAPVTAHRSQGRPADASWAARAREFAAAAGIPAERVSA